MPCTSFLRIAARAARAQQPRIAASSRIQTSRLAFNQARTFSAATVKLADHDAHDPHNEESFEDFTAR